MFLIWQKIQLGYTAAKQWECLSLQGRHFQQSVNQPQYNTGLIKGVGLSFRPESKQGAGCIVCVIWAEQIVWCKYRASGADILLGWVWWLSSLKPMLTTQRQSIDATLPLFLPPPKVCEELLYYIHFESLILSIRIEKFYVWLIKKSIFCPTWYWHGSLHLYPLLTV